MNNLIKTAGLIVALLAVLMLTACGDNITSAEYFNYETNQDGVVITAYTGRNKNVVVPSLINNMPVIKIDSCAFMGNDVRAITLPEGLIEIGDRAFVKCEQLECVKLPTTLSDIGVAAFKGCKELASVEWGLNIEKIGDNAFSDCISLKKIDLPGSLTTLGNNVFLNCYSLCSITISEANSNFTTIDNVLYDKSLATLYFYPMQKQDKKFEIPETVEVICNSAFMDNIYLSTVTLPSMLQVIGSKAFAGCSGIINIEIPASVETIGEGAFSACTSLTDIHVENDSKYFCSIDGVLFDKSMTRLMQYPAGKEISDYVIPNNVTLIDWCSFGYNPHLKNITFSDTVQVIGVMAFWECTAIQSLKLPYNLTHIGAFAFGKCSSLADVYIPGSVSIIPMAAFSFCNNLECVVIEDGVKEIYDEAFYSCNSLENICLPPSIEYIADTAFSGIGDISVEYSE